MSKSLVVFSEDLAPKTSTEILYFEMECRIFMRLAGNSIKLVMSLGERYGSETRGRGKDGNPCWNSWDDSRYEKITNVQQKLIKLIEKLRDLQNQNPDPESLDEYIYQEFISLKEKINSKRKQYEDLLKSFFSEKLNSYSSTPEVICLFNKFLIATQQPLLEEPK